MSQSVDGNPHTIDVKGAKAPDWSKYR